MKKEKFKIIEEGRLSKNKMGQIVGGGYICNQGRDYLVDEGPACVSGTASYSYCPADYQSCANGQNLSCPSKYSGPTGPGGIIIPIFDPDSL